MSFTKTFNYHIVPPIFLVCFTAFAQFLASSGNPSKSFQFEFILGNKFAWKCIGTLFLWAFIFLWIPSKKFAGPTTNFGLTPIYQANGELYYFASVFTLAVLLFIKPELSVAIYQNMGSILGGLNIVALSLCLYLLLKYKFVRHHEDPYLRSEKFPVLFEFYRGIDLHPQILGVDVKQLTNCRIGMIMWQLLVMIYFMASYQLNGFNSGHFVATLLQTIYIFKFFHWETGYFNTLDITLDRAGYYLVWGCLCWIPAFYAFPSYFFVHHPPSADWLLSSLIFVMGIASIYYNYDVDLQKEHFRTTNGKCRIWGKHAKSLKVNYKTAKGENKETQLLVSGWWGMARKINYTFELCAAFMWCCPGGFNSLWPYSYFFFLLILLVHRIFRDEDKCQVKYGKGWNEYCKKVPFRLLPNIF